MLRPTKRLQLGSEIVFGAGIAAKLESKGSDGISEISFAEDDDLLGRLAEIGQTPLPPYIHAALSDGERYQTVYGTEAGSSAAPTAGLHFTLSLLDQCREKGVKIAWVTLHVGIDTFRPITVENLEDHVMHGETCEVPKETADAIHACRGRVIAVGTTSVRTLETFATGPRQIKAGSTVSTLFIRPGYEFKIVDGIFTNFHFPRTTLMAMISAFAGRERVLEAYQTAVLSQYRFLSFGDSMLIL